MVRQPTAAAASRCPCSKSTPPTIGGKTCPKDSGQSGTARPDPVLVTRPPMKSSTSVDAAVRTAKRWSPEAVRSGIGSVRSGGGGGMRVETARLREIILGDERRAVLVGTTVDRRQRAGEVPVRRRGGRLPLERVRLPRIPRRALAGEHAPEEVDDEQYLAEPEDERADRDELVHRLEPKQEVVLRRVVDAAHVA